MVLHTALARGLHGKYRRAPFVGTRGTGSAGPQGAPP